MSDAENSKKNSDYQHFIGQVPLVSLKPPGWRASTCICPLTTMRWTAAKTYANKFTYIHIIYIYIYCGSQVNLNPALWDLHKLRAWGVAAVSLVLCILV